MNDVDAGLVNFYVYVVYSIHIHTMMNWLSFVYVAVLFFVLTPGILVSLPPKSSKWVVALVHAIVYTVILKFTYHPVSKLVEGFSYLTYSEFQCPDCDSCKGNSCIGIVT